MPLLGIGGALSPGRPGLPGVKELPTKILSPGRKKLLLGRQTCPTKPFSISAKFDSPTSTASHVRNSVTGAPHTRALHRAASDVLSECGCWQANTTRAFARVQGRSSQSLKTGVQTSKKVCTAALPAVAGRGSTAAALQGDRMAAPPASEDGAIIKSVEDKKAYRVITLPNGLTAVLIHDPEIKAAEAGAEGGDDDEEEEDGSEDDGDDDADDNDADDDDADEDDDKAAKGHAKIAAKDKSKGRNKTVSTRKTSSTAVRSGKKQQKREEEEEDEESDWETASDEEEDEELEVKAKAASSGSGKAESGGGVQGSKRSRSGLRVGRSLGKGRVKGAAVEEVKEADEDEDSEWDSDEEEDEETDEDDEDEDEDEDEGGRRGADMQATKKAAAAMCVGVGSFSDPEDAQGLAHFLEHMLFMGSAKYPDENDYDAFLSKHGGSSNAFTETEYTCFHFDVSDKFLKPALDRFAQFFIAPLAKEDAMEREVQAVDSEYQQVLQSDSCRLQQLQCSTAHPEHPFRKFSWGNRKSLCERASQEGVDMRKKLLQLYLEHYKAGAMKLAVLGGEPLDVLEEWVRDIFQEVRPGGNGRLSFSSTQVPLWEPGLLYRVESVKEQHQLTLSWPLPCLDPVYRKKPQDYLSHLIGHEGAGSLLALLKAKGWATGLAAGVGEGGYERSSALYVFAATVSLTDAGYEHVMEVIGLAYQYMAMLRQVGPQEWVFQELGAMSEMEFRFAEEEAADNYTVRLACNMQVYPVEDTIYGDYVHAEWDPQQVSEILALLSPHNMRGDLVTRAVDRSHPDVKMEPWFDVPYTVCQLAAEQLQAWADPPAVDPALHMPPRNEFIPEDFTLRNSIRKDKGAKDKQGTSLQKGQNGAAATNGNAAATLGALATEPKSTSKVADLGLSQDRNQPGEVASEEEASREPSAPRILLETDLLKLWYKLDDVFATPRANAYFAIWTPLAYSSARNAALTELFMKLVEDSLNEIVYLANVAKLESSATASGHMIEIKVGGFNDKLPKLVHKIFDHIGTFRFAGDRFGVLREELARSYRNSNMKPLKQSAYLRLLVLREHAWRVEDRLAAVLACTPADLEEFASQLLSQVFVEALVHGNLTEDEALAVGSTAVAAFPSQGLPRELRPVDRVFQLPEGQNFLLAAPVKNEAEENSVVEMYFQGPQDLGRGSLWDRCMVDLLEQIMYEPIYNQLRSKEQLGYRVDCGVRVTFRVIGFCIRVQSADYPPPHLQARIEAFLEQFRSELEAMDDAEFESHREALIAQKLQRDHSLADESDRLWDQIWEKRYFFDARQVEAAMLRSPKIQRLDLVQWLDTFLGAGSTSRRKLTIQIWGRGKGSPKDGFLQGAGGSEGENGTAGNRDDEAQERMEIDGEGGAVTPSNARVELEAKAQKSQPLETGTGPLREGCRQVLNIEEFKRGGPLFPLLP